MEKIGDFTDCRKTLFSFSSPSQINKCIDFILLKIKIIVIGLKKMDTR